ncbi:MAG: hypothetical protein IPI79_13565 [Moraxellaceae bacterium]|nr:hypothetical protein [Moraxellaceae bacterium]
MATMTAQILIGTGHSNDGGLIFVKQKRLSLSENSRISWLFKPDGAKDLIVWVATVENCLEDAFLMIAILIQRDVDLIELAKSFYPTIETERHITLYEAFSLEQRMQLYAKCRQITTFEKMIVTVFRQSHLLSRRQLSVIESYRMDIEVCSVCYSRLFSMWTNNTYIEGNTP